MKKLEGKEMFKYFAGSGPYVMDREWMKVPWVEDHPQSTGRQRVGAWCTDASPKGWCSFSRPLLQLGLEHHQTQKVHPSRDANFTDLNSVSIPTRRHPGRLTCQPVYDTI